VGGVDLITMPSPGMEPLTTILTEFARHHPDVTVNAEAGFTPEEVLDSVRSGTSEIGVLGSPEPTRAPDLDVIALESQALVLISGPDDERRTYRRRPLQVLKLRDGFSFGMADDGGSAI
jgi:DNA-binding transcriptional LysR family regulator